jgi:hypothetical protein
VSLGVRVLFIVFAILQTAFTVGAAVSKHRTMPEPGNDPKLRKATKHYRLLKYCPLLAQLSLSLVFWTLAGSSSVDKTLVLLVSIPMFLTPFLIAGMGFAWRDDFKLLRDAGLVKSP